MKKNFIVAKRPILSVLIVFSLTGCESVQDALLNASYTPGAYSAPLVTTQKVPGCGADQLEATRNALQKRLDFCAPLNVVCGAPDENSWEEYIASDGRECTYFSMDVEVY